MGIIVFIFKCILVILGILFMVGSFYDLEEERFNNKPNKLIIAGLICFAIFIVSSCVAVVPANTVGVKYSSLNGTSEKTLNEGIHFVTPFVDKIYEIDTTIQERTDEGVSVQTKDAQWVKMEVNVKYQVSKENAFKVYKGYKTLSNLNKNIIGNYAQDALNEVCSEYNVIDILGEKRNEILMKTNEILKHKYLVEGVDLKSLTIKDVDAGEAIEKAIQDEAVAKKAVETAKQNQEKAKTEAETKLIQAEGEAKANAVKTKELTDKILIEKWISKWNGELPKVSDEGNMIDISELLK
jgi:Membrane protease subunits, stomatin/prohibitin homologs